MRCASGFRRERGGQGPRGKRRRTNEQGREMPGLESSAVGTSDALEYESRIPTGEAIAETSAPVFEPRGHPLTTIRFVRSPTIAVDSARLKLSTAYISPRIGCFLSVRIGRLQFGDRNANRSIYGAFRDRCTGGKKEVDFLPCNVSLSRERTSTFL